MKTIVSALLLTALLSGTAFAQPSEDKRGWQKGPDRHQRGHDPRMAIVKRLKLLDVALDLDESQEQSIKDAVEQRFAATKEAREAMKNQMQALMCQTKAQIEADIVAVLDTAQLARYQELQAERQNHPGRGNRQGHCE